MSVEEDLGRLAPSSPGLDVADAAALDKIFRTARSRNAWKTETLPAEIWRVLYDIVKFGPTSVNQSPARFVFVSTDEGKSRLAAHLSAGNQKALTAPCIAVVGYDLDFPEHLPRLYAHNPGVAAWFADPAGREESAFRNSTLQGAYLMIAARAMGLDLGPMSGFDKAGVEREFFAGTNVRANFLCALGHGADEPHPRLPRLAFDEACRIV